MSSLENIFSNREFKCNVSSVLNRDIKLNGKSYMFDGLDDTAWSSDQGLPQTITITFSEPVKNVLLSKSQLAIKFQGGFVGSQCKVIVEDHDDAKKVETIIYPDDINDRQEFSFDECQPNVENIQFNISKIRFVFEKSSDFFGRIIIYNLELLCAIAANK